MNHQMSRLQKLRAEYKPPLPLLLKNLHKIRFEKKELKKEAHTEIEKLFPLTFGKPLLEGVEREQQARSPLTVGVVFSGGQASGGHNVIAGLYDALTALCPTSRLLGFLGGPSGIVENKTKELSSKEIASYRNQGGFDLIGSGRTKIETPEQLQASLKTVIQLNLDGLVIIGGDDSNTNAAILAEFFLKSKCKTTVVGVPKTIDGDLKNSYIATSFGFDSATKTYSETIGNIARDALSAKKYTHFIKLMGRSASHVTLECALSTHPNYALIGEEVALKKMTLSQITQDLATLIQRRSEKGKNYAVILIPEGLIEFIPEVKALIAELNRLLAHEEKPSLEKTKESLSPPLRNCFEMLPKEIQSQLLLERDPHGNIQVSLIETEKMLIELVKNELSAREFKGKFSPLSHFLGYEGRSGFPTNFDANYCYSLGYSAALLVDAQATGYIACVTPLNKLVEEWRIQGIPLTHLMTLEMRKGKQKPVIEKALVNLKGKAFEYFEKERNAWALEDHYRYPGPIQFFGEETVSNQIPLTLFLEA